MVVGKVVECLIGVKKGDEIKELHERFIKGIKGISI